MQRSSRRQQQQPPPTPRDGAGPSSEPGAAAQQAQQLRPRAPRAPAAPAQLNGAHLPPLPQPPGVGCLLAFSDTRVEAAYLAYAARSQQTADLCLIVANVFAACVALVKHHALPAGASGGPTPTRTLCLLSGGQSLGLLLLLLARPALYARHRGGIIAATRMYRLAVWLLYLREPYPPRLFHANLSLRLFLLSPAGGNLWLALFYPLPLPLHMLLLAASSLVAVWRSGALQDRLLHLGASTEQVTETYARLSRFSRLFDFPSGRLLQRWPAAQLSDADRAWCMYAFVTLVYGLLLPLLLLFIKEVHFRVRFLACLRPALGEGQLSSMRARLYSVTTAACFLAVTMVPCAWSLVQLASRYLVARAGGRVALSGVAFLLTVVSLEVFMRFWLLAVLQLLLQRALRPALLWLLLRLAGAHRPGDGVAAAGGAGARVASPAAAAAAAAGSGGAG